MFLLLLPVTSNFWNRKQVGHRVHTRLLSSDSILPRSMRWKTDRAGGKEEGDTLWGQTVIAFPWVSNTFSLAYKSSFCAPSNNFLMSLRCFREHIFHYLKKLYMDWQRCELPWIWGWMTSFLCGFTSSMVSIERACVGRFLWSMLKTYHFRLHCNVNLCANTKVKGFRCTKQLWYRP